MRRSPGSENEVTSHVMVQMIDVDDKCVKIIHDNCLYTTDGMDKV